MALTHQRAPAQCAQCPAHKQAGKAGKRSSAPSCQLHTRCPTEQELSSRDSAGTQHNTGTELSAQAGGSHQGRVHTPTPQHSAAYPPLSTTPRPAHPWEKARTYPSTTHPHHPPNHPPTHPPACPPPSATPPAAACPGWCAPPLQTPARHTDHWVLRRAAQLWAGGRNPGGSSHVSGPPAVPSSLHSKLQTHTTFALPTHALRCPKPVPACPALSYLRSAACRAAPAPTWPHPSPRIQCPAASRPCCRATSALLVSHRLPLLFLVLVGAVPAPLLWGRRAAPPTPAPHLRQGTGSLPPPPAAGSARSFRRFAALYCLQ